MITNNSGAVLVPPTPQVYAHDANGNLTSDGLWIYHWDAENRLIAMESSTSLPESERKGIEFQYDANGRRIEKVVSAWDSQQSNYIPQSTNRFVYDGWNVIAVLDGNNTPVLSFMWGTDLSGTMQGAGGVGGLLAMNVHAGPDAGAYFYCYDGNGNVIALVNAATATIAAQYEYGPFAEVIRSTGPMAKANPFRFSTKYQDDETDLLYYGYRYYNASTGRWLSRDPIGERGGRNLSAFVSNDPLSHYDLFGLQAAPKTPGSPASSGPCEQFEEWYQKEKADVGWMKELPSCPCKIKVSMHCLSGEIPLFWKTLDEVSSDADAGWQLDPDFIVIVTRKGIAANCIRSKPKAPGGPVQECCYDSGGKLITGGGGAGTIDRGSGKQHIPLDYEPYRLATKCDAIMGGNDCLSKYLEVRPVDNGNNCERNEPKGWW